jgi:hypothetical protein
MPAFCFQRHSHADYARTAKYCRQTDAITPLMPPYARYAFISLRLSAFFALKRHFREPAEADFLHFAEAIC